MGITINEDEDSVTLDEIRRALAQMKNGKSAGEDGIPAAGECGVRQLKKILNLAYKTETVPSEWQKRIIRPLFKKGEKAVCDNYRGVTLLTGKVYTRIIEACLRHQVEGVLNDFQFGFRPARSTMDPIFILKILLEKSREWGIGKYALFIDLEKAFDRVNRDHL